MLNASRVAYGEFLVLQRYREDPLNEFYNPGHVQDYFGQLLRPVIAALREKQAEF